MQHICKQCSSAFEINQDDMAFYEKVSPVFNGKKELIPPPTKCPDCRQQRRLAFRNERSLYRRKCDLTGREIIAQYPANSPYKVYEKNEWFSDRWDPLVYGRDFDFSRPFFEQYNELLLVVPRMALVQQATMENADYCNRASNDKNCYMVFTTNFSEDCYYCVHVTNCKNCVDCLNVHKSELCYECVDSYDCYRCKRLESCSNCSDSAFLKNCTACRNCLFCTNLAQKEYCVFNEQRTKEEYERMLGDFGLDNSSGISQAAGKFDDLKRSMIVREYMGLNNENVLGNYLDHCKNTHYAFECRETEDCKYLQSIVQAKDCMDYTSWGRGCELVYETLNCGYQSRNILFCYDVWDGNSDLLYSTQCMNSAHLFGCNGLRHKQYCIFNKQYSKEEYERLVPQIIMHMRNTNEYGEFVPVTISLFGYNETNAQDYFPLTKESTEDKGWRWKEEEDEPLKVSKSIPAAQLPDAIGDIPDDVLNWAIECNATGRPYKITRQELDFYRSQNIPLPRVRFEERHQRRLRLQNPRKLWKRECAKCGKGVSTTYSTDRPEIVYCEQCYLKEVY